MRLLTLLNQWITNETPQPNANERQRTCAEMPNVAELSSAVAALITALVQVRFYVRSSLLYPLLFAAFQIQLPMTFGKVVPVDPET